MQKDIYLVLVQNISFSLNLSLSRFGKGSSSSFSLLDRPLSLNHVPSKLPSSCNWWLSKQETSGRMDLGMVWLESYGSRMKWKLGFKLEA
jgi:hypothetical protein